MTARDAPPIVRYDATVAERYDADCEAIFGPAGRPDAPYYAALASAQRPGSTICEIAAGTGRVTMPVTAATSARVIAVEPSDAMRARLITAASAADASIDVCAGHFEELPVADNSCELVFSAFRSFQHLLTPKAQLGALAEIGRVLAPGGLLAMDLFDPDPEVLGDSEPLLSCEYVDTQGRQVCRFDGRRVDRLAQTVEVGFIWEVTGADGLVSIEESGYVIRYTFHSELRHLLARAGFDQVQLYASFDREPLGPVPADLIIEARQSQ